MNLIYAEFPQYLNHIAVVIADGITYVNKNYEGASFISAYLAQR